MMKLVTIAGLFLSVTALAEGGATTGNGGDPLRALFVDGRVLAVKQLADLRWCSIPAGVDDRVARWIVDHRVELMRDVLASPHSWISDLQPTCAFTQLERNAAVTLSFASCEGRTRTVEEAARLLVHESVHHFGIGEESFADEVAWAVSLSQPRASCPVTDMDPFDPASCTGEPMTSEEAIGLLSSEARAPEALERKIGMFRVYSRIRECSEVRGTCSDWMQTEHGDEFVIPSRQNPFVANRAGEVVMVFEQDRPMIQVIAPSTPQDQGGFVGWGLSSMVDGTLLESPTLRSFSNLWAMRRGKGGALHHFSGALTPSCLRLVSKVGFDILDARRNQVRVETEVVIFSQLTY